MCLGLWGMAKVTEMDDEGLVEMDDDDEGLGGWPK
jgi:hypothetical protein